MFMHKSFFVIVQNSIVEWYLSDCKCTKYHNSPPLIYIF